MNHYELLNIDADSDFAAIKRAYFAAVRIHTPDKDPKGFKAIREAYETLFNPDKRAEYDRFLEQISKNGVISEDLLFIKKLIDKKNFKDAKELLTNICKNQPNNITAKRLLVETLFYLRKVGLVEKNCKEILEKDPGDVETILLRAKNAANRGFNNKVFEYIENALAVEPKNRKVWCFYANTIFRYEDFYIDKICKQGMNLDENMFSQDYNIYLLPLIYNIRTLNIDGICEPFYVKCFEKFFEYFIMDKNPYENIIINVINIMSHLCEEEIFIPVIEKNLPVIENTKVITDNKQKKDFFALSRLNQVKIKIKTSKLASDKRIDKIILAITQMLLEGDYTKKQKLHFETLIITHIEKMRNCIKILLNEYPEFFKLNSTFYNEVLNKKMTDSLFEKYYKISKKYEKKESLKKYYDDDDYDDDDDYYDDNDDDLFSIITKQLPLRKEKVGRNAPCPCGSGKKYKKCCGK